MDKRGVIDQKGKRNQLADEKTKKKPSDFQSAGPSLAKEQERMAAIESQLKEILEGEEIPELGPEFREIKVPEKLTPTLPSEVAKAGVTVVSPPALPWDLMPQTQTVTLPLTKKKSKVGLTFPVAVSLRWLAEWCLRLIKITKGKIRYVFTSSNNHES